MYKDDYRAKGFQGVFPGLAGRGDVRTSNQTQSTIQSSGREWEAQEEGMTVGVGHRFKGPFVAGTGEYAEIEGIFRLHLRHPL